MNQYKKDSNLPSAPSPTSPSSPPSPSPFASSSPLPPPSSQPPDTDLLDNFCMMLIEDFLKKREMNETISTLRNEWKRPAEDRVLISWYDISLRLRLPELISSQASDNRDTILANLVQALINESSIRNRRTPAVTLAGLASLPKISNLPVVKSYNNELNETDGGERIDKDKTLGSSTRNRKTKINSLDDEKDEKDEKIIKNYHKKEQNSTNQNILSKNTSTQALIANLAKNSSNKSNISYLPEEIKLKYISKDLRRIYETIEGSNLVEKTVSKEVKRLNLSSLERAKNEENLKSTKKIPCGCCHLLFLYVNLPLKVSKKAIQDLRVKWSGKISSSNTYRSVNSKDLTSSLHNNIHSTLSSSSTISIVKENIDSNLKESLSFTPLIDTTYPRCYDRVGVCVFCAQFFQEPEEFRPSYKTITDNEKRIAKEEKERKEREAWDPLKLMEKDREEIERQENLQQERMQQEKLQQQSAQ